MRYNKNTDGITKNSPCLFCFYSRLFVKEVAKEVVYLDLTYLPSFRAALELSGCISVPLYDALQRWIKRKNWLT